VRIRRFFRRTTVSDQEEDLIPAIRNGVNGLCHHPGTMGNNGNDKFDDGDDDIASQRKKYGPERSAVSRHNNNIGCSSSYLYQNIPAI
jgi:hypothetical protein